MYEMNFSNAIKTLLLCVARKVGKYPVPEKKSFSSVAMMCYAKSLFLITKLSDCNFCVAKLN